MSDSLRCRSSRGVTVVEAAVVLPLFLLLLLGMVDLGYGEFQDSQASAAARDGARFGILDPEDTANITREATERTVGQSGVVVTVACLQGLDGAAPVVCDDAVPGRDRIRVVVEWDYDAPTGIGTTFVGDRRIRGSSTMVIVGRPVTVTEPTPAPGGPGGPAPVPGSCVATNVVSTQTPIELRSNGRYPDGGVTFNVTTNGEATCSGLQIEFPTSAGPEAEPLANLSPPGTFTYSLKNNSYPHTPGSYTLRILDASSNPIGSFTFTIVA